MTDFMPAGSAQPLDSTIDGTKWFHGVPAAGITRLGEISAEIGARVDAGAREFARVQIHLGRLLLQARELIPGDRQFGQWREQHTPITSRSSASKLMSLARQVGDGRITATMIETLPLSTLKELISAPDAVLGQVADAIEEGDKVTRREVREMVAEVSGPSGGGREAEGDISELRVEPVGRIVSIDEGEAEETPEEPVNTWRAPDNAERLPLPVVAAPSLGAWARWVEQVLSKSAGERLLFLLPEKNNVPSGVKKLEWAWLVFGLDPTPAYLPSPGLPSILEDAYIQVASTMRERDEIEAMLTEAVGAIRKEMAEERGE